MEADVTPTEVPVRLIGTLVGCESLQDMMVCFHCVFFQHLQGSLLGDVAASGGDGDAVDSLACIVFFVE